jgi:uncharacterized protein YceK
MKKTVLGLISIAVMAASGCSSVSGAQTTSDTTGTVNAINTYNKESTNSAAARDVISDEELDVLLAPIALYPDALLAQVLMASTYPLDVVEAARWQSAHPNLSGASLQEALDQEAWQPAVKSLVMIPEVLQKMNTELSWTKALGDAVIDDQAAVAQRIQFLRREAQTAGKLSTNEQQVVTVEANTNTPSEKIITITQAQPQVIYVPTYDPYVVYGTWWWRTPPTYWAAPPGVVLSSGYYWGNGFRLGFDLWGGFSWSNRFLTINVPLYRQVHHINRPARAPQAGVHRWVWHPPRGAASPRYVPRYYQPAPNAPQTNNRRADQPRSNIERPNNNQRSKTITYPAKPSQSSNVRPSQALREGQSASRQKQSTGQTPIRRAPALSNGSSGNDTRANLPKRESRQN